jgi:hypothetical protein
MVNPASAEFGDECRLVDVVLIVVVTCIYNSICISTA